MNEEGALLASDQSWHVTEIQAIQSWLAPLPKPLAIMTCNDYRSTQVVEACIRSDFSIPDQVSVLGVENEIFRCEFGTPTLSSIRRNNYLQGQIAAQALSRLMADPSAAPEEIRVEPIEIVPRESTAMLPTLDDVVSEAIQLIQRHACVGLQVKDLAQQLGVTRSTLERRFRKFRGHSPQTELRRVQIEKAKELLTHTRSGLKEITRLVGFQHPEYLNEVFKRFNQQTPGAYRKKNSQLL